MCVNLVVWVVSGVGKGVDNGHCEDAYIIVGFCLFSFTSFFMLYL